MAETTYTPATGMGTPLSTLGCYVSYAWGSSSTTPVTTGHEILWDCTRSVSLGGSPDKIETTVLAAKKNKSYINGLQDLSETSLVTNYTSAAIAAHKNMLALAGTSGHEVMWICVNVDGYDESHYIPCTPAEAQIDALEPNSKIDYTINLNVIGDVTMAADPTYTNDGTDDDDDDVEGGGLGS